MIKFMLLHAKSDGDEEISSYLASARHALEPRANGKPFEIVPGRDQFAARFKAAGSWDAWAMECGSGVNPTTREPFFNGYLVPWIAEHASTGCLFVGAGTAKIVESALRSGRRVFVFRGDGKTARVHRARCANAKDWKQGWALDHSLWS